MTHSATPTPFWHGAAPLVLASSSAVRAALLARAGIPFDIVPSQIDERAISARLSDAARIAEMLALAKAEAVASRLPGRLVLGCDQTLSCEGRTLHKPVDTAQAREQLLWLRGRQHRLHAALALVRDGERLWSGVSEARLTMREFSDAFLAHYLREGGPDLLGSVGVYRYEALGIHLFEAVSGDDATILGLPVLPLLAALRHHGNVAA
jgi:septum formation protein